MTEAEKKFKLNQLKQQAGELWSMEIIEKHEWQQIVLIVKMAKTRLSATNKQFNI